MIGVPYHFTKKKKILKQIIFCLLSAMCCCIACKNGANTENALSPELTAGKTLAETYCIGCHAFPNPNSLDQKSWSNYVLPRMAYMMGLEVHDSIAEGFVELDQGRNNVIPSSNFHKTPILSKEEFEQIKAYYLALAPQKLHNSPKTKVQKGLKHFEVKVPKYQLSPPGTTLVKISEDGTFYIGDTHSKSLLQFDKEMNILKAANVNEGAVWLNQSSDFLFLTVMGSFSPTDNNSGFLIGLPKKNDQPSIILLNELKRPVHNTFGDLDKDGIPEIVTCEFGKWSGGLSWWKSGKNGYSKHELDKQSGATKAYIHDFNQDGFQDIIALFAQGNERITIYYNQGNEEFTAENALQFSPTNGSSYFNLYDFNQDGHLDIIYTAGDNADFPPILKPYHGIYIYENDRSNQFKETFFYPLHGAYAAIPQDFDKDGDIDIAAIAFFPDFTEEVNRGFVYLENTGNFQMRASTFEKSEMGRWVVMDVGDLDQDGDVDIMLGSMAFEAPQNKELEKEWINNSIPFILLDNIIK